MRRYLAFALVLALTLCVVDTQGWSDQVVYLKDGRKIAGEVTKTATGYEIKTPAGTVGVGADSVQKVADAKTLRDELQAMVLKLDPNDAQGLYTTAQWAIDNQLLPEAQQILEQAIKIKPDFEAANLRLKKVQFMIEDLKTRPPEVTSAPVETSKAPEDLITLEDIYRIRRNELRPDDRVRVEFRDKVIERFLTQMQGTDPFRTPDVEKQFRSATPPQQTIYMLQHLDRHDPLLNDILIQTDPQVITRFRQKIGPIVANNCATVACHGGATPPGNFRQFCTPPPATNQATLYTNFAILSGFGDQFATKSNGKMIDRGNPDDSLLLQYGLPANLAKFKHPVPLPSPYRNPSDPDYRLIKDWIEKGLCCIPGGYELDYYKQLQPPPASAPATAPSKTAPKK